MRELRRRSEPQTEEPPRDLVKRMALPRELRRRFELQTAEPPRDLVKRVALLLRSPDCPLCGIAAGSRIELYVPPSRQRLWSLELRLEVTEADGGTSVSGSYALHPHVWAGYVAVLALSAIAIAGAFTVALAEWTMGRPLVALLAVPPLAAFCGIACSLAFASPRFATGEANELRSFVDDAIYSSPPLASGVRSGIPERVDTGLVA